MLMDLKPSPRRARALVSLRTRQVHQVKLRRAERPAVPSTRLPRQVPLLQNHREYRVRPRGLLVHLRPARGSAHRAVLQQADHLIRAARLAFADAAHDDGAVRAFSHADLLRRDVRVQQITHLLVVNLEKRASNRALAHAPPLFYPREDVLDHPRDDADLVVGAGAQGGATHRVRLAASRLPVRQHRRVVPVEARVHQGRHEVIVHPRLLRFRSKDFVKVERSVFAEDDGGWGRVGEALAIPLEAFLGDEGTRADGDADGEVLDGGILRVLVLLGVDRGFEV